MRKIGNRLGRTGRPDLEWICLVLGTIEAANIEGMDLENQNSPKLGQNSLGRTRQPSGMGYKAETGQRRAMSRNVLVAMAYIALVESEKQGSGMLIFGSFALINPHWQGDLGLGFWAPLLPWRSHDPVFAQLLLDSIP